MSAEPTTLLPSYSDHDGGPRRCIGCTGIYLYRGRGEQCHASQAGPQLLLPWRHHLADGHRRSPLAITLRQALLCPFAAFQLNLCHANAISDASSPFNFVWQSTGNNFGSKNNEGNLSCLIISLNSFKNKPGYSWPMHTFVKKNLATIKWHYKRSFSFLEVCLRKLIWNLWVGWLVVSGSAVEYVEIKPKFWPFGTKSHLSIWSERSPPFSSLPVWFDHWSLVNSVRVAR